MIEKSVAVAQMSCTSLCTSFYCFSLSLPLDTWLASPQFASKSLDTKKSLKHPSALCSLENYTLLKTHSPISKAWKSQTVQCSLAEKSALLRRKILLSASKSGTIQSNVKRPLQHGLKVKPRWTLNQTVL